MTRPESAPAPATKRIIPVLAILFAFLTSVNPNSAADLGGPVTFSKDVAPILFANCATCHRPGQSAPFSLLSFADASKHARDIARVTEKRLMPPWLPEHGYNDFEGERRLTENQISILQGWVKQGAVEGNPAEAPKPPEFASAWQLGEPDLVVEPAAPYLLPAEGKDIYFNFVVPIPVTQNRFVSGVELLPGSRAVHHAFISIDPTRLSRRKGFASQPTGFIGMDLPETASMPDGQLLGWQPGKIPRLATHGLSWRLGTNTDLVLQTHLNPQGKVEEVRPRLGLHFTSQEPTNRAFRLRLTALQLDIPAGISNYVAETSYVLPVDLSFVRVGGHAHYLCKEMQGYALLPGGEKRWLLFIKDWDFKWQSDYEYKTPIEIPKGSKIVLRFTYDNSTNNLRNPQSPPQRVFHGPQTTDEMGELYFQTMPRNQPDFEALGTDYTQYDARANIDYFQFRLKRNPADTEALLKLGRGLTAVGRLPEAIPHLQEAARLESTNDLPHFDLGSIYLRQGRASRAYQEFTKVVQLNPEDEQAHENLGIICAQTGRPEEARKHFGNALRINPDNASAKNYLQKLKPTPP